MKSLFLLALMVAAPASAAPSFDCGRASSRAERAICADPEASALDSEVATAYRLAASRLGDDANAVARLKLDQKAFVTYRDKFIDNENLVLTDYLGRRRDFLLSIDPTPREGVAGRWRSFWGETRIDSASGGRAEISHWMSEPILRSWNCGDPQEAAKGRLEQGALITGAKDNGMRFARKGRLLTMAILSEPDVETGDSCGHIGKDTDAMFPVMSAQPVVAEVKPVARAPAPPPRTAMAYFRLTTENEGNDQRFFVNAADYRAPTLAERRALLTTREGVDWKILEQTPEHMKLRHKTISYEIDLAVRRLNREYLRVKVLNPHETDPARRERLQYFELQEDGVTLDNVWPDKLARAADGMTPPLAFEAIPAKLKEHFAKVDICTHYETESPFSPAEEKRLRTIIRPEGCKALNEREMQFRSEFLNNPALADLLDRAILAYRSR
jgi:uncharacterized protein YecT (DUF1311 family)